MNRASKLPRILLTALLFLAGQISAGAELSGYVFVQEDGTLRLHGRTVHLFGIYIPETAENCFTFISPPLCGPLAVINLDFRIGSDWVYCEIKSRDPTGVTGLCRVDDQDLSAWMLEHGWALARPDAPFEYQALEKIARRQGRGLWGIPGRPVR